MRVRREELHDVFVEDGRCAVYVQDEVIVLSPVATTVLLATGNKWISLSELADLVEQEYGPPPRQTTEETLRGLVRELANFRILGIAGSSM